MRCEICGARVKLAFRRSSKPYLSHLVECQRKQIDGLKMRLRGEMPPHLTQITEFNPITQSWQELLYILQDLWDHTVGTMIGESVVTGCRGLYLATGGWSRNEEIIMAMEHNLLLWSLIWVKSERGGAHWFDGSRLIR